jgi:DNA-binding response OmpR family regulator
MKIFVIEDEMELLNSIISYFKGEGFICESASTFNEAVLKINIYEYDCYVIDIGLPDGNGINLIKELRKNKNDRGIIILSARKALDDKLKALNLGADDYLTKPFHLFELNARIRSIVRRRKKEDDSNEIIFNEIKIVTDLRDVYIYDHILVLTKKEYDILLYLVMNRNKIITKESIVESLWGDNVDSSDSYDFIYTHMSNLKKKMISAGCKDYIQNINRVGYKFRIN